jgi:hypothetical protein
MGIRMMGLASAAVCLVLVGCSPAPVADPTTAPALAATPEPVPTAVPLTISKVSLTESVARGDAAKVVISTAPAASCTIEVRYSSGKSSAAGLDDQTADASGKASWTWTVGRTTLTGTYPINVHCFLGERDGTIGLSFQVR